MWENELTAGAQKIGLSLSGKLRDLVLKDTDEVVGVRGILRIRHVAEDKSQSSTSPRNSLSPISNRNPQNETSTDPQNEEWIEIPVESIVHLPASVKNLLALQLYHEETEAHAD